jgi:hypothetical protein
MRADERGKVAPGMARTAQEADRGRQIWGQLRRGLNTSLFAQSGVSRLGGLLIQSGVRQGWSR